MFDGDATGGTDVTKELVGFLNGHAGHRVALAPAGIYRVTSVGITTHDLVLDFRGARLLATDAGVHGILRLGTSTNVTLMGPTVVGAGFEWDADLQNEHGIWIDGGEGISIERATISDTHGDGIYIGYQRNKNAPPVGVRIVDPVITRASRNGISPVAGEVTIIGGSIAQTGLFGVDFEPNDDVGARSIRGTVIGTDIRDVVSLESASVHAEAPYAIAAAGKSQATKQSVRVEAVTGDHLQMTIRDTEAAIVCDSVSDREATVSFVRTQNVAFFGNERLARD